MADGHPVFRMTRLEFQAMHGCVPEKDSIGMLWMCPDQKTIAVEVIFTDEETVDELERIFELPDSR